MRPLSLPAVRALVFAAIACCAVAVAIAIGGGLTVQIGTIAVRSHNPLRPLVFAVVFVALALSRGTAALSSALAWHWEVLQRHARTAAAVLALGTIAAGFHWGAFVAGGSDSYCYLNQAELIARGAVRDYEPLAEDSSWPGNFWSFVPAGHMPFGQPVPALVPICPAGYPLIMAAARVTAGRSAMFAVTPLMGGLAVYLMFLLGRHLAGPAAGLLAAALSAASPTFLIQLFQPMNDVTAAAVWAAALVAAISAGARGTPLAAAGAGLLTAAALVVRPNLVPLAAMTAAGVVVLARDRTIPSRLVCAAAFAAAAAVGPLVVLSVQNAMYGSPFRSGYGDLDKMFSSAHVLPNLERYVQWSVESHTILIVIALAAPFALKRYGSNRTAWWLLAFAVATLACYLPYVVFDAWWYTRFLLPAPSAVAGTHRRGAHCGHRETARGRAVPVLHPRGSGRRHAVPSHRFDPRRLPHPRSRMAVPVGRRVRRDDACRRRVHHAAPQRQHQVLRVAIHGRMGGRRQGASRRCDRIPAASRPPAILALRTVGGAAVPRALRRRASRRAGLARHGRSRRRQDLRPGRLRQAATGRDREDD